MERGRVIGMRRVGVSEKMGVPICVQQSDVLKRERSSSAGSSTRATSASALAFMPTPLWCADDETITDTQSTYVCLLKHFLSLAQPCLSDNLAHIHPCPLQSQECRRACEPAFSVSHRKPPIIASLVSARQLCALTLPTRPHTCIQGVCIRHVNACRQKPGVFHRYLKRTIWMIG